MPDAYFNAAMRRHILSKSVVGDGNFGIGLHARRSIARNSIVGYYSGPILTWNNFDKYHDQDDYIAAGQFMHPESGKRMSYHVVVFGPTRYMNHGHCPDYYETEVPDHCCIANVRMLPEKMLLIDGKYRPVWEFRTIRHVRRGEELLYDYGVHQDEIYYEVLRRKAVYDTRSERQKFRSRLSTLERRHLDSWVRATGLKRKNAEQNTEHFYQDLLIRFLNSPDSFTFPTIEKIR